MCNKCKWKILNMLLDVKILGSNYQLSFECSMFIN